GNPSPSWLSFVVTGKARSNIRHFLKSQQHAESIVLGKRLLEQALSELSSDFAKIPPETLQELITDLHFKTADDLLYAIGVGNQMAMVIAKRLIVTQDDPLVPEKNKTKARPLAIKGTEGMVVHFGECCQPIPGDSIVGKFQQGRGIIVHSSDCSVLKVIKTQPEQYIALRWDEEVEGEFWVDITVEVANERGVLAALATSIAEAESNIGNINVDSRDGRHNAVTFSISVTDRAHLSRVMRRVRSNKVVMRLYRKKQGEN
ncbi:MAG: RelA/SpoT AH/RIS domain-containing protein, partial [Legionellales bacterium]